MKLNKFSNIIETVDSNKYVFVIVNDNVFKITHCSYENDSVVVNLIKMASSKNECTIKNLSMLYKSIADIYNNPKYAVHGMVEIFFQEQGCERRFHLGDVMADSNFVYIHLK